MGHSLLKPVHRLANNPSVRRVLFVLRRPLSLLCLLLILPLLKPEDRKSTRLNSSHTRN